MNRYLALFSVILFVGCATNEIPEDIIPKVKMEEILTDMHYADAKAYQDYRGDSIYMAVAGMYLHIFDLYNIDTAQFNKSFRYYLDHPKKMDAMYQEMIDSTNARIGRVQGKALQKFEPKEIPQ